MARPDARRGRRRRLNASREIADGPAEWRLLLACARTALEASHVRELSALARAPIAWDRVLRLAAFHGVSPLLHRHLGAHPDGVPREVLVALWSEAEHRGRRNAVLAAELVALVDAFDAAAIRSMPYKGPTLAIDAYGDLALREFGDLDILVGRRDMDRATDLLAARGYVADYALEAAPRAAFFASEAQYHHTLRSAANDILVELHWKSDPDFAVERLDDDAWWSRARHVTLLGRQVPAMAPSELFLVLCVHGGKHHWESLGWLVDIAEFARSRPDLDWDWIAAEAQRLGARRRVALGLRLAARLLGAQWPASVRDWIVASSVQELASGAEQALRAPETTGATAVRRLCRELRLYDRRAHRVRHVARVILAPSLIEWSRWPLPRRMGFLYPFLRLARLGAKYFLRKGRGSARKSV